MKTRKQGGDGMVEATGARKGKITQRSRSVKPPAKAVRSSARNKTVEETGVTKKPITGTPPTPASPTIIGEVKAERPGIRKEHIKARNICRVTFRLPGEAAFRATTVAVVGDFNDWSREATPLEKLEGGDFSATVELDAGKEYRFRYLIDGQQWENDWQADKYVEGPYGAEDSVVCA